MSVAEFKLPDVGEGIHEAEIVRWLVHEGDRVQEFDPIVEVQTDKALVELPAPWSGTIAKIAILAGNMAHVGDVLVTIQTEGGTSSAASNVADTTTSSVPVTDHSFASHPLPVQTIPSDRRPKATPGVRYYAREQGIDLTLVRPSGRDGRIIKRDIDAFILASTAKIQGVSAQKATITNEPRAMASSSSSLAGTRIPFRGIRRATAEHVKRSAFTAPHVTAFDECDATELVRMRTHWNEALQSKGKRMSYLPFLMQATVSALQAFPEFNARLDEEAQEIELLPYYHIGMAVDSPDGLFVPVIRDVDRLSMVRIADEITRLADGVKTRQLAQAELRGSTFTITNMGPVGGLFATPILNYPEVGILAVHQIAQKPMVYKGEIVARDVLTLSLSFDHRVIDGATSVRFMNHIKRLVENPELLLLER